MGDFKLNEEQVSLAKKLFETANDLIQKYSYMEEAFKITVSKLKIKMNTSDDENIREIKEETQRLQNAIGLLKLNLESLRDSNIYSDGAVPAYTDTISFLIGVYSMISEVMYGLGKVEGYSSENIKTYRDVAQLRHDYNALKKSLIQ